MRRVIPENAEDSASHRQRAASFHHNRPMSRQHELAPPQAESPPAVFEILFIAPRRWERLQAWTSRIPQIDRPAVKRKLRVALSRRDSGLVLKYRTDVGTDVHARRVATRMSLQYDRHGQPLRIVGMTVAARQHVGPSGHTPGNGEAGGSNGAGCCAALLAHQHVVSTVCHDLRNALGAIATAVEVLKLQHGGGTDMSRRALQILDRQVARMAEHVGSLRAAAADGQAEHRGQPRGSG